MSVRKVVAIMPPRSASTSPTQVSIGTREHERQAPGHHQPSHGIESHGAQRVDLLRHLHRRDLGREARARPAGDDDRGDQRTQLAEMCDDHELRHVDRDAESAELRDAEEPDDEADEEVRGTRDRQSVGADLLTAPATSANRPSAARRLPAAPPSRRAR